MDASYPGPVVGLHLQDSEVDPNEPTPIYDQLLSETGDPQDIIDKCNAILADVDAIIEGASLKWDRSQWHNVKETNDPVEESQQVDRDE
jgi:hypothetical protein